jgi:hypothetical protein
MNEFSIVREEFNRRSSSDRRKKVNWILISYFKNGLEYRKSFEYPVTTTYNDMIKGIKI